MVGRISIFFRENPLLSWCLLGWLVLNIIQGIFTPLIHDEAYYWVFSLDLSIVYFDQMPGIAYLIRAGTILFPGEFGVRFFTIILSPVILYLLFILSGKKDPKWLLALGLSMLALHFNSFFTSPDSILSFAIILFLLAYKKYLDNPGMMEGLILGLAAAGVGFCKYQGILFILILVVVQFRFLKKPSFWLAAGIAIALLLPIILFDPGTVQETLRFQLADRGTKDWSLDSALNFIFSQVIILGPFAGPFFIWALIFHKPENEFLRSLKKVIFIYFGVLFYLSLNTRVEANWSAPVLSSILLIAVQYYSRIVSSWKWIVGIFSFSFAGILLLRIYAVWNFLPGDLSDKWRPEIHGWKEWAHEVQKVCGDEPVVFWNSTQMPSKYWFYSGQPAVAVSDFGYRKNQYNMMNSVRELQGKPAWLAAGFDHTFPHIKLKKPGKGFIYLSRLEHFYSYPDIKISAELPPNPLPAGDSLVIPVSIQNSGNSPVTFRSPKNYFVKLAYTWVDNDKKTTHGSDSTNFIGKEIHEKLDWNLGLKVPSVPGDYGLFIYLSTDGYSFSDNSGRMKVQVE